MRIISTIKTWLGSDLHLVDLLRGSGIYMLSKVLGTIGVYIFFIYISKQYGPEGNGVLSFVMTGAVLLSSITNLGLNTYLVKIIPTWLWSGQQNHIRQFVQRSIVTISVLSLLWIVLVVYLLPIGFSKLARTEVWIEVQYAVIISWPMGILLFIAAYFKTVQRLALFSFLQNNIAQFLALLLLLWPIWNRESNLEPVMAVAFTMTGMVLYAAWQYRRKIQGPRIKVKAFHFKFHLKEAFPMMVGGLAFLIFSLTDRMMLRILADVAQLGVYAVALSISNIALLGLIAFNAIAETKFSEIYAQGDRKALKQFVQRSTWVGIIVGLPALLVLFIYPEFLLSMFGQDQSYLSGKPVIYALSLGNLVMTFTGASLALLNMTGHQRLVRNILLGTCLLNFILNACWIPLWGISGAAMATMVSTVLWNILSFYFIRVKLGFFTLKLW